MCAAAIMSKKGKEIGHEMGTMFAILLLISSFQHCSQMYKVAYLGIVIQLSFDAYLPCDELGYLAYTHCLEGRVG
jgi:hypothetical protein